MLLLRMPRYRNGYHSPSPLTIVRRLLLFSPPSFNVAIMAEISELYRGAQKAQRQKTTVEMNTSFPSGLIYEVRVMRRFPMPPVEQMFYDSHVMSEVHDS